MFTKKCDITRMFVVILVALASVLASASGELCQAQQPSGQLLAAGSNPFLVQPAARRLPAADQRVDLQVSPSGYYQAPAEAPTAPADDELSELRERLEAAETSLLEMRNESKSAADKLMDLIKENEAGPELPLIRLSGFFQVEDGLFSQSAESRAAVGSLKDGVIFRRARLQALGNVAEFTRYSIEVDFATVGRPSLMDIWGEQSNLPFFGTIRIGHFRQPTTMDALTSVRHLEFLERSLPFQALDPFRRTGIMAYRVSDDEMSTLAYSVYATGFSFVEDGNAVYGTLGDTRFASQFGNSGGVSFAARGTHLLYYDEPAEGRYLLHLGGGYDFSEIGGEGTTGTFAKTYQSRPIPEYFELDAVGPGFFPLLDTGRILAKNFHFAHLELAGNYGSAHFQTEFMGTALNQLGGPPVYYYGAYLQGGYFLTGESLFYNKQTGVLDYVVEPFSEFFGTGKRGNICGWGAWEVAFRWSYMNLVGDNVDPANILPGGAGPPPNPNPGSANETTLAINWWWNRYTRVQFNWIHSMPDYTLSGYAPFDIFGTRFQVEF